MYLNKFLLLLISVLLLSSCESDYEFQFDSPKKIAINKSFSVLAKEINDQPIDKITYSFDGKSIKDPSNIKFSTERLGKHVLSALIFYGTKTKKLTNTIILLADKEPIVYNYKIINTYPHDVNAYTQGLEYKDGFLYESTGRKGRSSLRKVNLTDGKVIEKIDLAPKFFAEGMTILHNKIYQLTWQSKKGFIYDFKDFKQIDTFKYGQSIEGWGLTNDGEKLIKTDGTEKVWFLDSKTLKETGFIESYSNKQKVSYLNELEYVNGKIYANVWQKNIILIMNPKNGAIEGIADLNGLEKEVSRSQNLDKNDDVLNGIAYDKKGDRLFVTGKHWGKLFEIKLIERE
ncbi:MAG TPA: glutaminyl-peptide cyclotransferase [Lutibacter sp.]|nr:glutaminyl-peptide cyclotransferase [Lutibacter sp.]